jgi:hypothetical protein
LRGGAHANAATFIRENTIFRAATIGTTCRVNTLMADPALGLI